jgi:phage portal protein BeeE
MSQVAALAAVFGVSPSYLLDRGKETSFLDAEVLDALANETTGAILREVPACQSGRRRSSSG